MDNELFKDDASYYADRTYLSNSSLKLLRESPLKYKKWVEKKWDYPSSPYFAFGSALHSLFLEGVDAAVPYGGTRRGKAYEEFRDNNPDKYVLAQKEYEDLYAMNNKLINNVEVMELMDQWTPEVPATIVYKDVNLKGKADAIVDHWSGKYIVDLKTTAKSIDEFYRGAKYMLYNQQAAIYCKLFDVETFYFVVIEKAWPFEIGIFKCSPNFIEAGTRELDYSIQIYKHLFIDGHFKENYAREFEL